MIAALLILAVLALWLGCLGFGRLPTAYARLHCVPFVIIAVGVPLTLATFLADGVSSRSLKVLFLMVVLLVSGAALAHATGRAIALHAMNPEDQ